MIATSHEFGRLRRVRITMTIHESLSLTLVLALSACVPPALPLDEEGSTDSSDDEGSDDEGSDDEGSEGDPSLPSDLDPERLDRSEDIGPCGYPGPGPNGYGVEVGQRIAPFSLVDCNLEPLDFAELFCPRDDTTANRAILIALDAAWCAPSLVETETFTTELYEPMYEEGLEIIQVLVQGSTPNPATPAECTNWRDQAFDPSLAFPVLLDPDMSWSPDYLGDAPYPHRMLIDANANIRWRISGGSCTQPGRNCSNRHQRPLRRDALSQDNEAPAMGDAVRNE